MKSDKRPFGRVAHFPNGSHHAEGGFVPTGSFVELIGQPASERLVVEKRELRFWSSHGDQVAPVVAPVATKVFRCEKPLDCLLPTIV